MRTPWPDLPPELRAGIEALLGSAIVHASSQPHGFSPGSADRVVCANGSRAFIKAVSREQNPHTYQLHLQELGIMRWMPRSVTAPRLIGSWVSGQKVGEQSVGGQWVALILQDIEGRHPRLEAGSPDVDAALDSIATLPHIRGRQPPELFEASALPEASALLAEESDGWVKLTADSTGADLPPWVLQNVARLTASALRAGDAVQGDHLVHLDCRADNMLVDARGRAWLVDWPWACIGAPWLDGLSLLLDARLQGGELDTDRVLREHPLFTDVPASSIDAVLSALAGSFFHKARLPAPPNLPTLRAFQRSEAIATARWLRQRWSEAAKPSSSVRG